jgi:hypothetical protein
MKIIDAITKANELVLKETGVACEPSMVRLIQRGSRQWYVVYDPVYSFSLDYGEGAVVDGGEVVVSVDFETGNAQMDR